MTKEEYAKYLDSDWWQNLRRLAIERADAHCAICGSEENLNAHHNTYERLGHERLSDLVVLCQECHELYHAQLGDRIGDRLWQIRI